MALPDTENTINMENAMKIGFSAPQFSIPSVFLHDDYFKRASEALNRCRIAWQRSFGALPGYQLGGKRRSECYPTAELAANVVWSGARLPCWQTNAVRSATCIPGRLKTAIGESYRYLTDCLTSFFTLKLSYIAGVTRKASLRLKRQTSN